MAAGCRVLETWRNPAFMLEVYRAPAATWDQVGTSAEPAMQHLRFVPATLAFLLGMSPAVAQNIGPGTPDVVMECLDGNNQPAPNCRFTCGTELASPPDGKKVTWSNVDRVEIHHKGSAGRVDTRSWVFVRFRAGPGSPAVILGLYVGPRYFCSTEELKGPGAPSGLTVTKFGFD
jgi:hypothetical protein